VKYGETAAETVNVPVPPDVAVQIQPLRKFVAIWGLPADQPSLVRKWSLADAHHLVAKAFRRHLNAVDRRMHGPLRDHAEYERA
jgi:hypothetical protein